MIAYVYLAANGELQLNFFETLEGAATNYGFATVERLLEEHKGFSTWQEVPIR